MSDNFSDITKKKTNALTVQVDRFESAIKRANDISSTIEEMSNEVSRILGLMSSFKDELTTTQHQQEIVLGNISDSINYLSEDVKQQKSLLQSIHSDIKQANTDLLTQLSQSELRINNAITATNNKLEGATASILNGIKVVQYIGYAILVCVVITSIILHFV